MTFIVMPQWLEIKGEKVFSLRHCILKKAMAFKENVTHVSFSLLLSHSVHPAPCVFSTCLHGCSCMKSPPSSATSLGPKILSCKRANCLHISEEILFHLPLTRKQSCFCS